MTEASEHLTSRLGGVWKVRHHSRPAAVGEPRSRGSVVAGGDDVGVRHDQPRSRVAATWFALSISGFLAVSGCGSTPSTPAAPLVAPIRLPAFEGTCPLGSNSSSTVPIRVVRRPGTSGVEMAANVCIDGSGPFPFLVDTGAATTVVDSVLANRLHLPTLYGPETGKSFGCSRQLSISSLRNWSVGDTALPSQMVVIGSLRSPVFPNAAGLLGSDTLSQFGAVRIDYQRQVLTLGTRDMPLWRSIPGSTAPASLPVSMTSGTSLASPMNVRVISSPVPGQPQQLIVVRPTVELSLGSGRYKFAVDTGASVTIVAPNVVRAQRFPPVGETRTTYAGLACRIAVSSYEMPSARLGQLEIRPQRVGSNRVPSGLDGLFGSATLAAYNPVVVDYADGELLLGHGDPGASG